MSVRVIGTRGSRAIVECPCGVLLGVPARRGAGVIRHMCPGCYREHWRPLFSGPCTMPAAWDAPVRFAAWHRGPARVR